MSAAHTPGPLRVARAKNGGGDYAVMDANKNIVAEFFEDIREQGECARDEARANATLFAAANELLAFAQSLVDAWESKEGMPYPCLIASAARAVIAKATARAPEGFTTLPPAALAAARAFGAGLDEQSLEQGEPA